MPKPRIGLDDRHEKVEEADEAEAAQEPDRPAVPERAPDMPLRWGDLAKTLPRKRPGDVLVHPRPSPEQDDPAANDSDEGPDTQPLRVFSDERLKAREEADNPGGWEAHVADAVANLADRPHRGESGDGSAEAEAGDSGPPLSRVRSTPTPPEE
ncbi:hypothetical protein C1I98_22080 [Spongiactinospora gelatinilytica]|uniref:Uncharacterized protein n=1 Tax=Spongiactinospora gelatinilytica TaxID=2666298 RepID=A0A2W2GEG8_9ACTN|nr:hypothetical protein C1I98_22080 [Spongiactinospora gelatinilytica]